MRKIDEILDKKIPPEIKLYVERKHNEFPRPYQNLVLPMAVFLLVVLALAAYFNANAALTAVENLSGENVKVEGLETVSRMLDVLPLVILAMFCAYMCSVLVWWSKHRKLRQLAQEIEKRETGVIEE